MAVKDFMTRKVVYVSPDTTVAHTADMMREQGLRRLPVIENDRLVGVVTETTTHTMASGVHSASDVQTDAAPSGKSKSASKLLSK